MERILMISDIHGCIEQFDQILNRINYNSARDQLILLGDYVDRGPNSKEAVERVMELVHVHNAVALRGNHDQRLVDLVKNLSNTVRTKFLEHGGRDYILFKAIVKMLINSLTNIRIGRNNPIMTSCI